MQMLALVWGMLAMAGFLVGVLPCLGALNWINIPFAVIGAGISLFAMNNAPPGRRGTATVGLVLNLVAIVIGFLRLKAGAFVL